MRGGIQLVAAALIAACTVSACSLFSKTPEIPDTAEISEPEHEHLVLLDSQHIDSRLVVLTLRTPALDGPTKVQILLPDRYDSTPAKRYPVLYLLQGAVDDYTAWIREGNAEALTAGYPMILVMPDAGKDGFYADWYNDGALGPPQWETYHIDQLIPWIDAHYRTVAARRGRAIGGVSMGGFGAVSYAARHPDLFAAVVSFSGLVNSNSLADQSTIPDKRIRSPCARRKCAGAATTPGTWPPICAAWTSPCTRATACRARTIWASTRPRSSCTGRASNCTSSYWPRTCHTTGTIMAPAPTSGRPGRKT